MDTILYSVKAASNLVGISAHTLRAWENRYHALTPGRSSSGRRRYNADEVERLKYLSFLVRRGHNISQIAQFDSSKLLQLMQADLSDPSSHSSTSDQTSTLPWYLQRKLSLLTEHLQQFQLDEMAKDLEWARVVLSCRELILQVLSPLLTEVGKLVSQGVIDVGQEHAFSSMLRNILGEQLQAMMNFPEREKCPCPPILFATPEGDLHEFGILLASMLALNYGLKTQYLGPNLPALSMIKTVKAQENELIVLGNSPVPVEVRRTPFVNYLMEVDGAINPKVELWIGGQGDRPRNSLPSGRKILYLNSLYEIDTLLEKRLKRLI